MGSYAIIEWRVFADVAAALVRRARATASWKRSCRYSRFFGDGTTNIGAFRP